MLFTRNHHHSGAFEVLFVEPQFWSVHCSNWLFFFNQHKKGETFSKPSSFGTGLCWQWKQQRFLWIFQNKSLKLLIFLLDNRIVSHFRVPSCDIVSVQLTSFVCVTSTNQFDHRVHLKENFVLWVDGHWCWFEWWWLDEWSNQHPLWNCQ